MSAWVSSLEPSRRPGGEQRPPFVLLFPPAGSHGATFELASWQGESKEGVWVVNPPGRGQRIGEPSPVSVEHYASAVVAELVAAGVSSTTVFVGASFGAVAAYACALELEKRGSRVAKLVPVAGRPPRSRPMASFDARETALEVAHRSGYVPAVLLSDSEAMEDVVLPPLVSDLEMSAKYSSSAAVGLDAAVHVVVGSDDELVDPSTAEDWRRWCSGPFEVTVLPGNHTLPYARLGDILRLTREGLSR